MKKNINKNILFLFLLVGAIFAGADDGANLAPDSIATESTTQQAARCFGNLDDDLLKKVCELIPNLSSFAFISKNNVTPCANIIHDRIAAARTAARTDARILAIRHGILRTVINCILDNANLNRNIENILPDSSPDMPSSILWTAADVILATTKTTLDSISNICNSIRLAAVTNGNPAHLAAFRAADAYNAAFRADPDTAQEDPTFRAIRNAAPNIALIDGIANANNDYDSAVTTVTGIAAAVTARITSPLRAFYVAIATRNTVLDIICTVKYVARIILPICRKDNSVVNAAVFSITDSNLTAAIAFAVLRGRTADALAAIDSIFTTILDAG
jgi:hypothetical protein